MLDELDDLREAIKSGDYSQAFAIIDELDEMSRDDKINKIHSYMRVLLTHLIKQVAERRSTPSWTYSIDEALQQIRRTNKRRQSGGYYLDADGLKLTLQEAWDLALRKATLEAFGGAYSPDELAEMISQEAILADALGRIRDVQS